jgi:hypothetical protein
MTIPGLTRPTLTVRTRRTVLLATAGVAAALGAAIAVLARPSEPHEIVPIPYPVVAPVSIQVPPAPPPTVVVQPAPAPPPPPPAPPLAPPSERPRALTPTLDPACVIPSEAGQETAPEASCTWDNGFPAIANDGSLIAMLRSPDTAGRETHALSVAFIDSVTARVVRSAVVVTDAELEAEHVDRTRLYTTVYRRVAGIQKTLDAGKYRTLIPLGYAGGMEGVVSQPRDPMPTTPYADISHDQVRIVDPATATVLGRISVGTVASPYPPSADPDAEAGNGMCHGWTLWSMSVSWDPATRVVLAGQTYRTGGSCMCPDISAVRVARLP